MNPRVVLHIGFHKTGTKSIQYWMRDHEELLAEQRIRFPRGWLRLNHHVEMGLTLMRLDRMASARLRGDEWRDPVWRADVLAQVADDLAAHHDWTTVLSAEELSMLIHDDELGAVRALVGDATVIAYLRDPADFLASMAAHYCKPGMPGLSDDPAAFNYTKPDSWLVDYDRLLDGWSRHFNRVYVKSYDTETVRDGTVIPSFLRQLGIPEWRIWSSGAGRDQLNRRADATPRAEGNRWTTGGRFGDPAPVMSSVDQGRGPRPGEG